MKPSYRPLHNLARWAVILLLFLAACDGVPVVPATGTGGTPDASLAYNPQALAPAQAGSSIENQPAATAEIQRANAEATLNSAISTLSAAQTQDQGASNAIAAQIAATAELQRANAAATLVAAGSTQNAAAAQDLIRARQASDQATTNAEAVVAQQNAANLAANTQTAVAEGIATEARAAVATSQWYTDQARQRSEQRQVPIGFLWTWGLPLFIVLLAGFILLGVRRWLKVRLANQTILNGLLGQLPLPVPPAPHEYHNEPAAYLEGEAADGSYQVTEPEDQVQLWLDEVKHELRDADRKDEEDDPDN